MQYLVEILVLLELIAMKFMEQEYSRHSSSCQHKEGLMRTLYCLLSVLSRVALVQVII